MPAKKKTAPVKLTANPRGSARVSKKPPLTPAQLKQIDAYWRASNYLTACQLYLLDNPLLERPLTAADLKQTIVGHWGTCRARTSSIRIWTGSSSGMIWT